MTQDIGASGVTGKSAVLWAIVGALFAVCFHLHSIRDAIRTQTTFYLCIELARLGGEHPSCERLLAEKKLP